MSIINVEPKCLDMALNNVKCKREEKESPIDDSSSQAGEEGEVEGEIINLQSVAKVESIHFRTDQIASNQVKEEDEESCAAQMQKCLDATAGMMGLQGVKNEDVRTNKMMHTWSIRVKEEKEDKMYFSETQKCVDASLSAEIEDLSNEINENILSAGMTGTLVKVEQPHSGPVTSLYDNTMPANVYLSSTWKPQEAGETSSQWPQRDVQSLLPRKQLAFESCCSHTRTSDGTYYSGCSSADLPQGVDGLGSSSAQPLEKNKVQEQWQSKCTSEQEQWQSKCTSEQILLPLTSSKEPSCGTESGTHGKMNSGETDNLSATDTQRLVRDNGQNKDIIVHKMSRCKKTQTCEKAHQCSMCDKRFADSYGLREHTRTHTGEKPYECSTCDKKFAKHENLKTHLRIHTGEKPYHCKLCHKRFAHGSTLKVHRRTHTGEKPYQCTMCDKTFAHNKNLKEHLRTHTSEKPYQCTICDKRFAQNEKLKVHTRTHTGEKPYQCTLCNKKFVCSEYLKTHMRTHTGEKPYHCTTCDKRFADRSTLIRHGRIHTGEK